MTIPQTLSEEIEGLLSLSAAIHAEADSAENLERFQQEAEQQKKGTRKGLEVLVEELKAEWLENRLVEAGLKHARSRGMERYLYLYEIPRRADGYGLARCPSDCGCASLDY